MNFIHDRVSSGERLYGTWCSLGSSITVEMAGVAGFDWVLLDLEHGIGDFDALVRQLQVATAPRLSPIVRVPSNDAAMIKRVLDLGAVGVMIPYVQSAEEARQAVRAMRYPPYGIRGAAAMTRATTFATRVDEYFSRANRELLTIVQIESLAGIENADEIAAVDGVDVMFVGPFDLSFSLGFRGAYKDPLFLNSVQSVIDAAKSHGVASGILASDLNMVMTMVDRGMTFVAIGSDSGLVAAGMKNNVEGLRGLRFTVSNR